MKYHKYLILIFCSLLNPKKIQLYPLEAQHMDVITLHDNELRKDFPLLQLQQQ